MTCPTCQPLAATSEQQYDNRLDNLATLPGAGACPCHACGGTDWVTTTEFIGKPLPPSFWKRLLGLA